MEASQGELGAGTVERDLPRRVHRTRSVRIRGPVVETSREESLADLHARSAAAQEGIDPDDWTVWRVVPTRVEFWQASEDRHHIRVVFLRSGDAWRVVDA